MAEESPTQILLGDPLNEVTRKERRSLLGVSAIGIAVAKTGTLPSEIGALGVKFSEAGQEAMARVLAGVVIYFLLTFLVYGAADLLSWKSRFQDKVREIYEGFEARGAVPYPRKFKPITSSSVGLSRAFLDFMVPIMAGAVSIWWLLVM